MQTIIDLVENALEVIEKVTRKVSINYGGRSSDGSMGSEDEKVTLKLYAEELMNHSKALAALTSLTEDDWKGVPESPKDIEQEKRGDKGKSEKSAAGLARSRKNYLQGLKANGVVRMTGEFFEAAKMTKNKLENAKKAQVEFDQLLAGELFDKNGELKWVWGMFRSWQAEGEKDQISRGKHYQCLASEIVNAAKGLSPIFESLSTVHRCALLKELGFHHDIIETPDGCKPEHSEGYMIPEEGVVDAYAKRHKAAQRKQSEQRWQDIQNRAMKEGKQFNNEYQSAGREVLRQFEGEFNFYQTKAALDLAEEAIEGAPS